MQCWIEVARVLFLILVGKHLSFHYKFDVGCGLFVDALYQVEEALFSSQFIECFYHEQVLEFVECFFCID